MKSTLRSDYCTLVGAIFSLVPALELLASKRKENNERSNVSRGRALLNNEFIFIDLK